MLLKQLLIPKNHSVFNALLILIAFSINLVFQVFCIPSNWAIIIITVVFINTVFSPLIEKKWLISMSHFIDGFAVFMYTYCIFFLNHLNFIALFFLPFGIGFLIFIPHYFVAQTLLRNFNNKISLSARIFFICACFISFSILTFTGYSYRKAIDSMEAFKNSRYKKLEKNFMTEKILGMHFKYHTAFCEYDGWRPPVHEPLLVIGMWLNKNYDPLKIPLNERLRLYKLFFSENDYKLSCSCALNHRKEYLNDKLWESQ